MEPNIENIHKWIAALRSGEYPQGTGLMRSGSNGDYRYCPLGVAVQVADPTYLDAIYGNGSIRGRMQAINEFYGMVLDESTLPYEGRDLRIISLSDAVKLSFAEIADLLEAKFPKPEPVTVGGIVLDIPRAEDLPVATKVMEMVVKCGDQEVLVLTGSADPVRFMVRRHGVWTGDVHNTWAEAEAAATLLVQQAHRKALAIQMLEEKLG